MKQKKTPLFYVLRFFDFDWDVKDDSVEMKNEVTANKMTAVIMVMLALLNIILVCLSRFAHFFSMTNGVWQVMLVAALVMLVPALATIFLKGRGKALKYIMLFAMLIALMFIYFLMSTFVLLALIIPLVLSCRYYDKNVIVATGIATLVVWLGGTILGAVAVKLGSFDLKVVHFDDPVTIDFQGYITPQIRANGYTFGRIMRESATTSLIPNLAFILSLNAICYFNARSGKRYAETIIVRARDLEVKKKELEAPKLFQESMLPKNEFEHHQYFRLYGKMNAAREVGGDMYDFYFVDEDKTKLAFYIADGSGKGMATAMFVGGMKLLFREYLELGFDVAEAATRLNKKLCQSNPTELFITAWLGVIDLKTGVVEYVNAGHTKTLLSRNGEFEYMIEKHRPAIACVDTVAYQKSVLPLNPGDRILLYTDGFIEGVNDAGEEYGDARFLEFVRDHAKESSCELMEHLHKNMENYEGNVEIQTFNGEETIRRQFDDQTALIFDFVKPICEA